MDLIKKLEDDKLIMFEYKNWKGKVSKRTVMPWEIWFGKNEFTNEEQWMLRGFDKNENAVRNFVWKNIIKFIDMITIYKIEIDGVGYCVENLEYVYGELNDSCEFTEEEIQEVIGKFESKEQDYLSVDIGSYSIKKERMELEKFENLSEFEGF